MPDIQTRSSCQKNGSSFPIGELKDQAALSSDEEKDMSTKRNSSDFLRSDGLSPESNSPRDISVWDVFPVADDMRARFSATSRTYHYYIHTRKDPFERHFSLQINYPLDFNKMNEAAKYFLQHEDYAAFCKAGGDNKTTICHVTEAKWVQTSPTSWYFEITANRFLRNMVRAVVGTLIDVGRGKISMNQFLEILHQGTRSDAGESMPGNALS